MNSPSLRGALRIGEKVTLRRHRKDAVAGRPWGGAALKPMSIQDAERDVERAITAIVALDDIPPAVARTAARVVLLTRGWLPDEEVECFMISMRFTLRAKRGTLSVMALTVGEAAE